MPLSSRLALRWSASGRHVFSCGARRFSEPHRRMPSLDAQLWRALSRVHCEPRVPSHDCDARTQSHQRTPNPNPSPPRYAHPRDPTHTSRRLCRLSEQARAFAVGEGSRGSASQRTSGPARGLRHARRRRSFSRVRTSGARANDGLLHANR